MNTNYFQTILLSSALLLTGSAAAQEIEAIYGLKFENPAVIEGAMEALFADKALRGNNATLYRHDLGVPGAATHSIVVDYDNYADREKLDKARTESHAWAKYVLAVQGSETVSADLSVVLEDFGKPRHTAGYLVAYDLQVSDISTYRAALKKLAAAIGNPGVMRFVELRSGSTDSTHTVLLGAKDFAAANTFLDKLFASAAYAAFSNEV